MYTWGVLRCAHALFLLGRYECRKRSKNKLRLKKGEILIVGKDGKVKKINTSAGSRSLWKCVHCFFFLSFEWSSVREVPPDPENN